MVDDNEYTPAEVERRRDEVIRKMANTPPQPKPTSSRPQEKKTKAASDRAAGKGRARREG
ncbi:MAG: hypothetical protein H5U13_06560 [Parvibaculum sp.]|nr:hypothetical protein [Parvibaculum sp.]